ncbi:hypothetical protein B4134_2035 [Bacillus safensis]|nr:hypothetical protein B4107_1904 [Bacillus safensis]KIL21274.1 hypothetical protein B4134_2035 [Bacillus safensis]
MYGLISKTNDVKKAGDRVIGFFVFACDRPAPEYSMKGKEHGRICKILN